MQRTTSSKLTKAQVEFLLLAKERPRVRYGSTFRTVSALAAHGLVEEAGTDPLCHATLFRPTNLGLEALALAQQVQA